MSRLFISHSSQNDDWAIALRDWLTREGWSGESDIFLDLDPEHGIAAGERWVHALADAATRCEAVLFLVSEAWLASKWCVDEYQLANKLSKRLFALLIDDVPLDRLPGGLTAQWQVVSLRGEPAVRFLTIHPHTQRQSPVHISEAGLKSLKRGLQKAGIGAETFELQPDPQGLFGWRAPYRGLEALEPEDAAVFFGRSADILRGLDALRGVAARKPPRLLVILGASGAGKSSFLRAGLWPRLARDDSQWLPLRTMRAGRGGAIEGSEGLVAALEDVHRRFAIRASRADLRQRLATPERFVDLLRDLRDAAARRALLSKPPYPLPVLCLDQAEELFVADAGSEGTQLLRLARAAIENDAALLLATIRSDAYGLMQTAPALAGIDQVPLSLGPVPAGEIARVIREPAEILRKKVGPDAPVFDAAVVERLQAEIAGEVDALPLLAFVLQRLMREHGGTAMIGLAELKRTGGVAAAIESEAEAALADAGLGRVGREEQRAALRRLFIPRLARIDREHKVPQRRIARQQDLPAELLPLAQALTARRLLVAKLAAQATAGDGVDAATLEVAHEALLRHWPTLADLLTEDRDALLLLDGVLLAAADWEKAEDARKGDFLAHRGSRLADAQALAARGPDWAREIAPASAYLAACAAREATERTEKEAAHRREQRRLAEVSVAQARTARLQRRARWGLAAFAVVVLVGFGLTGWLYQANLAGQAQLDLARVNLFAELAAGASYRDDLDRALRLATQSASLDLNLRRTVAAGSFAHGALGAVAWQSNWKLSLIGHEGFVMSAAFNPSGTRIVTASSDNTARIWDATSGREIAVFRGHERVVNSAAFSPDGTRIVTASSDNTARIWDATSGREIIVFRGHEGAVDAAAFSPDGARIVTASYDDTARIWDVASGTEIAVLHGHKDYVLCAAFSPDGSRIVTASSANTASIWDVASGTEIAILQGHAGIVWSAAFSPDGARIVTTSEDKTARIWDAMTGKEVAVLRGHEDRVYSGSFSPDGSHIVTASFDKTARIWDVASGKEIAILRGYQGRISSARFSPDGSSIVTASENKIARVWDVASGKDFAVLHGHEGTVLSPSFSPDGSRIVTASADQTVRLWDVVSQKEIEVLRGHEGIVNSAAFSPDGSRIVTASEDKTARIWEIATAKEITVLRHGSGVYSASFNPDGSRIVTASEDTTARIWDVASGSEIAVLRGHKRFVTSAAFSRDGRRIVTASGDGTARVWDAASGKEITVLRGHENSVTAAMFSPDGTRIVTASLDETARIWDVASGKQATVLRGHEAGVLSAAFSPDGIRIVTASEDKTARIWDATSGMEIAVLREHEQSMFSAVIFSPDGSTVATTSWDRTVRVWDVHVATESTQDLVTEVCTHQLRGFSILTRDEMRLAGYPDELPAIDVCAENK